MKKILLSVLTVLAVGTAKADEKAWYLQTDTNAKVALEKVDYLLAADDDEIRSRSHRARGDTYCRSQVGELFAAGNRLRDR